MMTGAIVVGVTDATVAGRAVAWAAQRAVDRRQRLRLVSVVGGAVGAVGEDSLVRDILETTSDDLERAATRLREQGIEVEVVVERGNPIEKLFEASGDAALLVIGSDYRGPESGPARGAHGIRIVSAAPCPVVVVPDIELTDRSGVVVGVDGSEVSENAIAFAAREADRLGEPLVAVSVWTPLELPRNLVVYSENYLTNMQQLTEEILAIAIAGLRRDFPDLEIVTQVECGHPSTVINDLARSARMTVVGSHGRGAFMRFLLGSISYEVLLRLATVTAVVR